MRLLGFLFALLLVFGALMPHAASTHRHSASVAMSAGHEMGNAHAAPHRSVPVKDCGDCTGKCVGCAAPLKRMESVLDVQAQVRTPHLQSIAASLTAFATYPELKPPRPTA